MNSGKEFIGCSKDVYHLNYSQDEFECNEDNWQGFMRAFNEEIRMMGFSGRHHGFQDESDWIFMINGAWWLLQKCKTNMKTISDLHTQAHQSTSDMRKMFESVEKQKKIIEVKARLVNELMERENHSQTLLKEEKDTNKYLKDEVRKSYTAMKQKETQFLHEIKRKDQEIFILKEKLIKTIAMKSDPCDPSFMTSTPNSGLVVSDSESISNSTAKSRPKWKLEHNEQKAKVAYHMRIVTEIEKKLKRICTDFEDLKTNFSRFCSDLASFLQTESPNAEEEELDPVIYLPYSKFKRSMALTCENLLQKLTKFRLRPLREGPTLNAIKIPEGDTGKRMIVELQKLYSEGRECLELNEELQRLEHIKIEEQKARLKAEASNMEKTKMYLLLLSHSNAIEVPFDLEEIDLPSWTLGNATATINSFHEMAETKGQKVKSIGPQYASPSRPPSRPQSRSHSRNRNSASPSPNVMLRRTHQRPRSCNMSPQRLSYVNVKNCNSVQKAKLRTGSMSPSDQNRLTRQQKLVLNPLRSQNYESSSSSLLRQSKGVTPSKKDESSSDLDNELQKFGNLILRRQQSSSTTSESEVEEHLINVTKALNRTFNH